MIGWCPKFVEAQTRSDFFTELRLPTCQPAALLSSCLFFLVHFFRKQIWQIGKIATCLEIFSDSFLIQNDDTPSSLIWGGGAHCSPLNILGLGGVRASILFVNDLLWDDVPFSKGFMKFGCLEPPKKCFIFEIFVRQRGV